MCPVTASVPHAHGVSSAVSSDERPAEGDRHVSEEVVLLFAGEEAESGPNGHTATIQIRTVKRSHVDGRGRIVRCFPHVFFFGPLCRCAALSVLTGIHLKDRFRLLVLCLVSSPARLRLPDPVLWGQPWDLDPLIYLSFSFYIEAWSRRLFWLAWRDNPCITSCHTLCQGWSPWASYASVIPCP